MRRLLHRANEYLDRRLGDRLGLGYFLLPQAVLSSILGNRRVHHQKKDGVFCSLKYHTMIYKLYQLGRICILDVLVLRLDDLNRVNMLFIRFSSRSLSNLAQANGVHNQSINSGSLFQLSFTTWQTDQRICRLEAADLGASLTTSTTGR